MVSYGIFYKVALQYILFDQNVSGIGEIKSLMIFQSSSTNVIVYCSCLHK